jgi:hypothetical protein
MNSTPGAKEEQKHQAFGKGFLDVYLRGGFGSLTKTEIDLLVFSLLEKEGFCLTQASTMRSQKISNYDIAKALKITTTRLKTLQRSAHARWPTSPNEAIQSVLKKLTRPAALEQAFNYSNGKKFSLGYIPLLIENAAAKDEFEQAIKKRGVIPYYERNREVLLVPFDVLVTITRKQVANTDRGEKEETLDDSFIKKIGAHLAYEIAKDTSLSDLLTMDTNDWTSQKWRNAGNRFIADLLVNHTKAIGFNKAANIVGGLWQHVLLEE